MKSCSSHNKYKQFYLIIIMKEIIKKGNISLLISRKQGGGLSKEVHLLKYSGKKYVLRRCKEVLKAKRYESISKRFAKYGFLPKFLGRFEKDVLFEYIQGRELTGKESLNTLKQIGKIAGYINKVEVKGNTSERFYNQLKELTKTKYTSNPKKKEKEIKRVYEVLKARVKPVMALDINDCTPDNFILNKESKVYLVDIESIAPRIKGFGFAKAYLKFCPTPEKQKAYLEGYNSVNSTKYLTEEYLDFIYINFFVQRILYDVKYFNKDYKKSLKRFEDILKKYKDM